MDKTVDLSIVIVNYKVRDLLAQTIRSLRSADNYNNCEVIVVDNDSQDGSEELITTQFPEVIWIGLKTNVGFGKGCNIGAEKATSDILLMLNPDTIVSTDTLTSGVEYMKSHPDIGILGPKVLNQDGTFYKQCHRGLPTPANAFGHFTGLSKLFPKSKKLSSYFMTWLSPDDQHEVDAISGSCFFIPTDLYREIGGFDETFFMYGEDLDICVQTRLKGKKVWYAPISKVIHFQGQSSTQRKIRSRLAFYNAMIIFSRKYAGNYGSFFPQGLIEVAVFLQAVLSTTLAFSRQLPALLLDLIIINTVIPIVTYIRFEQLPKINPYEYMSFFEALPMHLLASCSLALPFAFFDMVRKKSSNYMQEAFIGPGIFFSFLFFAHSLSFSRMALVISTIIAILLMVGWRLFIPKFSSYFDRLVHRNRKTILLGEEEGIAKLLEIQEVIELDTIGIIHTQVNHPGEVQGYPVLNSIVNINSVISQYSPDRIIIASSADWYSSIIDALADGTLKNITIQWLPPHSTTGELKEFSLS